MGHNVETNHADWNGFDVGRDHIHADSGHKQVVSRGRAPVPQMRWRDPDKAGHMALPTGTNRRYS